MRAWTQVIYIWIVYFLGWNLIKGGKGMEQLEKLGLEVFEGMGLRDENGDLVILSGCDYFYTILKFGSINAFKYIEKYKRIEKVFGKEERIWIILKKIERILFCFDGL